MAWVFLQVFLAFRRGSFHCVVDVSEEEKGKAGRPTFKRSACLKSDALLVQHSRHGECEFRNHRLKPGAVFGSQLISTTHGANHGAKR